MPSPEPAVTVRSKVVFNAARAVLPEVLAILLLHLGNVRRCGLLDLFKILITAPGGDCPATLPGRPVTGPIGTEPGKETHNLGLAYPVSDPARIEVNVIASAPYRKPETASRMSSVCGGNRDSASPRPGDAIPMRCPFSSPGPPAPIGRLAGRIPEASGS